MTDAVESAPQTQCCQTFALNHQRKAEPIAPNDAKLAPSRTGEELVAIINSQLEDRFTGEPLVINVGQFAYHLQISQKAIDHVMDVFQRQGWHVQQTEIDEESLENDDLGLESMINSMANSLMQEVVLPDGSSYGNASSTTLVFSSHPFV